MRRLSRRGHQLGLYTCLSLGLLDLVLLNVWIVPSLDAGAAVRKAPARAPKTVAKGRETSRKPPSVVATQAQLAKPRTTPRAAPQKNTISRPIGAVISEMRFASGQHRLRPTFRQALSEVARRLAVHPEAEVELVGHCDRRGSTSFNQRLSLRRAQGVKAALARLGVAAKRLHARGAGASQPAARGDGEEVWAKNRRVQIRWR